MCARTYIWYRCWDDSTLLYIRPYDHTNISMPSIFRINRARDILTFLSLHILLCSIAVWLTVLVFVHNCALALNQRSSVCQTCCNSDIYFCVSLTLFHCFCCFSSIHNFYRMIDSFLFFHISMETSLFLTVKWFIRWKTMQSLQYSSPKASIFQNIFFCWSIMLICIFLHVINTLPYVQIHIDSLL